MTLLFQYILIVWNSLTILQASLSHLYAQQIHSTEYQISLRVRQIFF